MMHKLFDAFGSHFSALTIRYAVFAKVNGSKEMEIWVIFSIDRQVWAMNIMVYGYLQYPIHAEERRMPIGSIFVILILATVIEEKL